MDLWLRVVLYVVSGLATAAGVLLGVLVAMTRSRMDRMQKSVRRVERKVDDLNARLSVEEHTTRGTNGPVDSSDGDE